MNSEKLLIVEDERIIAYDLQRRLSNFGYVICGVCANRAEVMEALKTTKPQLVLMDIMLENGEDGIDLSADILTQFGIPSIFLTAYSDDKTLERAKKAQPLGYLLKPFKERELYSTIDMAIYKSQLDSKLKDQEMWLSAILNSVADGIIALDNQDLIHFLNPVAIALLGYRLEEMQGKPLADFFRILDEESMIPIKLLDPDAPKQETVYFTNSLLQVPDGQLFNVEGKIFSVQFDSIPIGQVIMFRDISQVKRLANRIDHQSKHDALTGLVNRKEFTYRLTENFFNKVRKGVPHALIYMDLDQFKLINDTCGHLAGDELLRQAADIIKRTKDSNTVVQSRLGGDEFAILLEEIDTTQALEKAWVIKHSLNSHDFIWQNTVFKIKASMGVIPIHNQYDDVKTVLAAADDACYLAKEEGGNKIKVYEIHDDSFQKRRGEMRWITKLNQALEQGDFKLYFQSIVPVQKSSKLKSKEELLIRLKGEDGKLIMPFDFIPAAERYNLMPQIDRWVIRTAISNYHRFVEEKKRETMFCINLSGESIADSNLVSFIKHEIRKNNVDPTNFCFEITETATISNLGQAITFIKDLKSIGCLFALDDFGSGFSSFAYLKTLPVDYLKIDGTFIKNLDKDEVNYAMVEAIYKISRVMGLKTIAEFVSSKEIRDKLQIIGIDYAQGYEIHVPAPLFND